MLRTFKIAKTRTELCRLAFKKYYSTGTKKGTTSEEYIINLVRSNDHENFLCTLLLPSSIRATAMAIRAFNIEISRIQIQIKETNAGLGRLAFWDNSIDKLYNGEHPAHPVLIELHKALKKTYLSKLYFKRLIRSRADMLNVSTFKTPAHMESYADNSNTPVYLLLLEAHGTKNVNCDHVAGHLGKAQGLLNLLRSLPHNIPLHSLMLPQSLLLEKNITEESIYRGEMNEKDFRDVVFRIATMAHDHMKKVKSLLSNMPKNCPRAVFLPMIPTKNRLRRLQQCFFDPFDPYFDRRDPFLAVKLIFHKTVDFRSATNELK